MKILTKEQFLKRLEYDKGLEPDYPQEELPEAEIEKVTAGIESGEAMMDGVTDKAKKLAAEIKKEKANSISSDQASTKSSAKAKQYFHLDVESKANVRGIKLKGHKGLEITGFKCVIKTDTNKATYKKC